MAWLLSLVEAAPQSFRTEYGNGHVGRRMYIHRTMNRLVILLGAVLAASCTSEAPADASIPRDSSVEDSPSDSPPACFPSGADCRSDMFGCCAGLDCLIVATPDGNTYRCH